MTEEQKSDWRKMAEICLRSSERAQEPRRSELKMMAMDYLERAQRSEKQPI